MLAYVKDISRYLLDPLQFAYRANRFVDDAVNMGLYYDGFPLHGTARYGSVRFTFVFFSTGYCTWCLVLF